MSGNPFLLRPVSRILSFASVKNTDPELPSFIWSAPHGCGSICLPLPADPKIKLRATIRSRHRDIHGISTHKVYPYLTLRPGIVRSYHTFSPLSRHEAGTVIFCDTCCIPNLIGTPPVRWCGALRCPDFPQQTH